MVNLADVRAPINVGVVAYKSRLAFKIQLELGGEFRGSIPAGRRMILIGRADPATRDSKPDHNPGDGIYYRSDSMHVIGNCWFRSSGDIAYPGAEGLTIRYFLILLDEARVAEFQSDQYRHGYNDVQLDALGAERLAYFDVPTADLIGGTPPTT